MASVSVTGGPGSAWAVASRRPACRSRGERRARSRRSRSGATASPPAGRSPANAASSWSSGTRGKRTRWVSKVESLNAHAPASTSRRPASSARAAGWSPTAPRRHRLALHLGGLGREGLGVGDHAVVVVRHVHDRGDARRPPRPASRGRCPRRARCGCARGCRRGRAARGRRRSPARGRRPAPSGRGHGRDLAIGDPHLSRSRLPFRGGDAAPHGKVNRLALICRESLVDCSWQ